VANGEAVVRNNLGVLVITSLRIKVCVGEGVGVLARLVRVVPRRILVVDMEVAAWHSLHWEAFVVSKDAVVWVDPAPA
jgi:hypothetical protein